MFFFFFYFCTCCKKTYLRYVFQQIHLMCKNCRWSLGLFWGIKLRFKFWLQKQNKTIGPTTHTHTTKQNKNKHKTKQNKTKTKKHSNWPEWNTAYLGIGIKLQNFQQDPSINYCSQALKVYFIWMLIYNKATH